MRFIRLAMSLLIIFTAYYTYASSTFSSFSPKIENKLIDKQENIQINNAISNITQEKNLSENIFAHKENLSINTKAGAYDMNNCMDIKHTDGKLLTFCISRIEGMSNGFYDYSKSLIVVESLEVTTIVHELVHASTVHNSIQINDDIKRVTDPIFQERIAYDTEYLLSQILKVKLIK